MTNETKAKKPLSPAQAAQLARAREKAAATKKAKSAAIEATKPAKAPSPNKGRKVAAPVPAAPVVKVAKPKGGARPGAGAPLKSDDGEAMEVISFRGSKAQKEKARALGSAWFRERLDKTPMPAPAKK